MPAETYKLIALGARYWFVFLGAVIVWRSFVWLRKDARLRRRRLKQLPDAGLVGELVVLAGNEQLPPGTAIPLPREGTLGSLRSCDVSIPMESVSTRHGDFRFVNGVGLVLTAAPHRSFVVDGEEPEPEQREWVMHHGSRLRIGDALLRMRLFMGLETTRTAAFQPDEAEYGLPQTALWQEEEQKDGMEPSYVVLDDDYSPGWEDYTQPRRQVIQTWQDTGRYPEHWQTAGSEPWEETGDEPEEFIDPDQEDFPYNETWENRYQEPPEERQGLFHRRRRRRE